MESVAAAINKSSNAAQSLSYNKSMFQRLSCPHIEDDNEACGFDSNLKTIIIHLNDEHKWSREDIADWLDTLENQPVFYPDIRTDDEKIEDAKKEKQTSFKDAIQNIENKLSNLVPIPGFAQSGPMAYKENTPISSYNTFSSQLTYGGLNAGSTVTVQYGGSTISGYVESIEAHYSGYKGTSYTVTFHSY